MLSVALIIWSVAVALGIVLTLLHLRNSSARHWLIGMCHGVLGATGLGMLILALRGPAHGMETGVASFGVAAAVLAAVALLVGLWIVSISRRSGRGIGPMIVLHGTVAVTAYVLLAAYVSLG